MRRLMSLETRITRASGRSFCSASVCARMALSLPWPGRLCGRALDSWRVWKKSRPDGGLLAVVAGVAARQLQAPIDLLLGRIAHHVVEEATHLAHVARGLREPLLVRVELFEHDHGEVNVVLLEPEDGGRVVHQHVGVEHEQARDTGLVRVSRFAGRCRSRAGFRETSPLQVLPPRDREPSPCATPAAARPWRPSGRCCARCRDISYRRGFSPG